LKNHLIGATENVLDLNQMISLERNLPPLLPPFAFLYLAVNLHCYAYKTDFPASKLITSVFRIREKFSCQKRSFNDVHSTAFSIYSIVFRVLTILFLAETTYLPIPKGKAVQRECWR
jgi:hypothetical protein